MIQNNIVRKADKNEKLHTAELIKNSPTLVPQSKASPSATEASKIKPQQPSKKIVISNKARLSAYIRSKQNTKKETDSKNTDAT